MEYKLQDSSGHSKNVKSNILSLGTMLIAKNAYQQGFFFL